MYKTDAERRVDEKNYILEFAEEVKAFKEVRASVFGMSIPGTYAGIAHLSLRLNDVNEARRFFYKSAKIALETFSIFKGHRYPHLTKVGPLPFTSLFVKSFPSAVLCGNDDLMKEYMNTIYEEVSPAPRLLFNSEIMHAIIALVQGDRKKAQQHIARAHQPENFKGPYAGFSHAVKGIIDHDTTMLNEGILRRLKFHIKDTEDTIYHQTCAEATAFAKMAVDSGMNPDRSSPYINNGLIENIEPIVFDGIDEILNSLAIADRKNSSLLARLGHYLNPNLQTPRKGFICHFISTD